MNRKMIGIVILASMVSGFLGGMIAESMERPAFSETTKVLKAGVIQAQEILLTDPQGNRKVILGADKDGSILQMYDSQGKPGVFLEIGKGYTELGLNDSQGKTRMLLSIDKTGPTALFYDAHGKMRIGLKTTNSGEGLGMYDANGRRRVSIGWAASLKIGSTIFPSGSGIMFFDKKGHLIWLAPQ